MFSEPQTQYQSPGTLFYQTSSNAPPSQSPAAGDNRGPPIIFPTYNNLPIRQQPGQKPTQVYINLDQPIQQGSVSMPVQVQSQKPQVTMEKINDRYHVEIKHDAGPPHQLPEGVVYTPLISGMQLHPNVMQMAGNTGQVSYGFDPLTFV